MICQEIGLWFGLILLYDLAQFCFQEWQRTKYAVLKPSKAILENFRIARKRTDFNERSNGCPDRRRDTAP